jgi:type IV secretory pathway VirB4 component
MSEIVYAPNSTQQFVEIEDIKNGVVTLKDGAMRAVVMVSGINFELKSEEEQDSITAGYQNFLNALDFSIQIVIHSRKLNISRYLERMEDIHVQEKNELLRNQISEYIEFIRSFVKQNEIMTKNFFVVVPYDGGGLKDMKDSLLSSLPFLKKKKSAAADKQETMEEKVGQLQQRVDQVIAGLERMGLRAVVLADDELTELYYNLYNPETVEKQLPEAAKGPATK